MTLVSEPMTFVNLLRIVFAFALEFPEFNRTKRARSFEKVQYFYFIFNSASFWIRFTDVFA